MGGTETMMERFGQNENIAVIASAPAAERGDGCLTDWWTLNVYP